MAMQWWLSYFVLETSSAGVEGTPANLSAFRRCCISVSALVGQRAAHRCPFVYVMPPCMWLESWCY